MQQRVEIIKALANDAKVLILDEPTAVLTPQEIDELMEIMRALKEQGTSIIFITHKLREVKAVGDRITVIRRGKVVGTAAPTASEAELAEMMVGREVKLRRRQGRPPRSATSVLEVRDVTVVDPRGHQVVKDVSFEARAGEVLGIAGVQGNGQTELIKALLGLIKPDAGAISLDGDDISKHGPARRASTTASATSPRTAPTTGSSARSPSARTSSSTSTAATSSPAGSRCDLDAIAANADARIEEFDIRTESASTPGLARSPAATSRRSSWPGSSPGRSRCSSPPSRPAASTSGSIEFIHKRIIEERDKRHRRDHRVHRARRDLRPADRIAVMYDGRIVGTVTPDIAREDIGLMMAGAHEPAEEVSA